MKILDMQDKAKNVTGRGSTDGYETSMLPYFLENWYTDGSESVSIIRRQSFTPRKIPDIHFC
jgi:hypothetical protein